MKAYLNGHTIQRHMYHGDRWYKVDAEPMYFVSTSEAAQWIRDQFGTERTALAA